jgi:CBS domain containing-hemolysin-like protein
MISDLAGWLDHPVTLTLAGVAVAALLLMTEVALRNLGELGNVRFQGLLESHPGLLPVRSERGLHLSRALDALRWLEVGCIGVLWLVLSRFPSLSDTESLGLALLLPFVLVVAIRSTLASFSEDVVAVLLRLLRPLSWPLVALVSRLGSAPAGHQPDDDDEEATDGEIQAYLEAGHAAGIFEREDGEIVESLVDFFDTVVREVMTPRTEMVAVADTASHAELLEIFARTHKSRIPVYHDTIDRIVGMIHVKNLVKHLMRGHEPPLEDLLRDCLVVPESKELGELLRDFQRERQQLAIVVDEYGGTSGLVTLEDILEEIVGEIQDEHDPKPVPEVEHVAPGTYRMQGRAPLEVLEELFDIDLDDEDMDTVGGLVFSRHGTVPEPGTIVDDPPHGLRFVVETMDERRIVSVTVRREELDPTSQATTGGAGS